MVHEYADIGIKPTGSLGETATILGQALGGLVFKQDTQGRFDEYPAFIAESGGLRYALLGVPRPEDDVRDEPNNDFALLVEPFDPRTGEKREDISEKLISKIEGDGRLACWRLG